MNENDERLEGIVREVAKGFGFEEVNARYQPFKTLKINWTRSYNWISMDVSDYLIPAPDSIQASVLETLFGKIRGSEISYTPEVARWLGSDEFLDANQPKYISRCIGMSKSTKGDHRDLQDSFDRLMDMGLVDRMPRLVMGWGPKNHSRKIGTHSVLLKVVTLGAFLDDLKIPQEILDYGLYWNVSKVMLGFIPDHEERCREYEEILGRFPGREKLEREIALREYSL